MSSSITLQVGGLDRHKDPNLNAYPLRLTVASTTGGIPLDLFVFHATPEKPEGYFYDLATVDTIESLPRSATGIVPGSPFARCSTVKLVFQSHTEAVAFKEDMKRRLTLLAKDWDNASVMLTSETIVVTGSGSSIVTPSSVREIPLIVLPEFVPDVVDTFKQVMAEEQDNDLIAYLESLKTQYAATAEDGHELGNIAVGGWVPVAYAPLSWTIPPGAKFFYNYGGHMSTFRPVLPLVPDKVDLLMDGVVLPRDVVYTVTDKTVFWLDYEPSLVPAVASKEGNAPWAIDYVDLDDTGAASPNLILRVYT